MRIPNGFLPSELAPTAPTPEDFSATRAPEDASIDMLPLQAAPFLVRNILRNLGRRNYIIAPGGRSYLVAGKPVDGE